MFHYKEEFKIFFVCLYMKLKYICDFRGYISDYKDFALYMPWYATPIEELASRKVVAIFTINNY